MATNKEDWTMEQWRDYYDKLRSKAEYNYQMTGMGRYDNEMYKYDRIVEAFNGYLEHKNEADTEKLRRQHNIDAYVENHLYKDEYTKADVMKLIKVIREF